MAIVPTPAKTEGATTGDPLAFLSGSAPSVAPRLLGCELVRTIGTYTLRAKIVETEAYDQADAASHSYRGRTARTDVMFGPPGFLYVYFTYGMHYCCNIVVEKEGRGAAVLIRAVEPLGDESQFQPNRPGITGVNLTNGPAKVTRALGIDGTLNGHNLRLSPLLLVPAPPVPSSAIVTSRRVGITRAIDVPWRFSLKGNSYVSRPVPRYF